MRSLLAFAGFIILSVGFATVGLAAKPEPTVRDFLATCAKASVSESLRVYDATAHRWNVPHSDAYVQCTNDVTMGFLDGAQDVCAPEHMMPDDARVAAVQWLRARPKMAQTSGRQGVHAALEALYPCH